MTHDDDLHCPVPCSRCGRIIELDESNFYTRFCECDWFGGCDHGICDTCRDELDEEVVDDA